MELTFTIDTSDLDFESLLTDSFRREIINNSKKDIASEKFKEFSRLVSDTIVAETKLKLENFLSEEIVLTGRYGETDFVGSIEDLIRKRFDDILLRPVDNSGKTLQGCTSCSKTWIEWSIERELRDTSTSQIKTATDNIEKWIEKMVSDKLIEIKNGAIKEQIDNVFTTILKKG